MSDSQIKRAIFLLQESELTFVQIAERLGVSKGVIQVINAREEIRTYNGHRTQWKGGINS